MIYAASLLGLLNVLFTAMLNLYQVFPKILLQKQMLKVKLRLSLCVKAYLRLETWS
jgi:hypothetical protein